MHIVASIQARLGSTRLPGKVLLHLVDDRLLQWVIDRSEKTETITQTIAAIGDRPENEAIIEYCKREGIRSVVGPEENLLMRHVNVVEQTNCDLLVRITADCPFIPTEEIDRVVRAHQDNGAKYTTNHTDAMPIGTAVDVIAPELLFNLQSQGMTHPVRCLRSNSEEWGTVWSDNPDWHKFEDVHLAVDTPSDYWSLVDAVEAVGEDPKVIAEWLAQ